MALHAVEQTDTKTGGIAADRLRSIVDRIERLEEERKALGGDIRDIYAEAKSAGFEVTYWQADEKGGWRRQA